MRTQQFRPQQVIDAIRRHHGMLTFAATALRCNRETIRNYAKRYPEIAEALREEREKTLDLAELALYNAILAGEPWAICFYLKTQGRSRGYTERREVTGTNGEATRVYLTWHDTNPSHDASGSSAA
jgi:hypothetical protein